MSLTSLKSRLALRRAEYSASTSNRSKGRKLCLTTVAPVRMSRADWDRKDPNGWERSAYAEAGIDIEYSDEDSEGIPKKLSRIERIRACSFGIIDSRVADKSRPPSETTANHKASSVSVNPSPSRITAKMEAPRKRRDAYLQKHVASCKNCVKAAHCRLAAIGREAPCQEWWSAPGCNVKWSDYVSSPVLFY